MEYGQREYRMMPSDQFCISCGTYHSPELLCRPILLTPFLKPYEPMTHEVDHPNHYSRWKMEPVEFIAINDLPWWLANIIKYTMRYDAKDGLKDLYKARSYLDMKIRQLEGEQRFWEKPVAEERRLNVEKD